MKQNFSKILRTIAIVTLCISISSCTWLLNTMLFPKGALYMSFVREADITVKFPHSCIKQALMSLEQVHKIDYKTVDYTNTEGKNFHHHYYTYRTKNDEHPKTISLTQREKENVSARHSTSIRDNFFDKEDLAELNNERPMMYIVEEAIEKECGLPPASFYEWRDCEKIHHPEPITKHYNNSRTLSVLCHNNN